MPLVMRRKLEKISKAKPAAGKRARSKKDPQTLAELNAWFKDNWRTVVRRAKANNVRLTGSETI